MHKRTFLNPDDLEKEFLIGLEIEMHKPALAISGVVFAKYVVAGEDINWKFGGFNVSKGGALPGPEYEMAAHQVEARLRAAYNVRWPAIG